MSETKNKKILEFLKNNKEVITTLPVFIITFLGVLYEIIRYFYSQKAEQFYGIPKFYFYDNLQADYIMNLVYFIVTIMLFFSPFIIKKFSKKNKLNFFESLIYSFLFAFLVFYLLLAFCVSFILNTLHITGYDNILLFICIVVAIISWMVYFFIFKTDLTEHTTGKQEENKSKDTKDALVELKTKKNSFVFLGFIFIVILIVFIIAILMYHSALFIPSKKKNYEIIQVGKEEYNVIVGYYKESAIIMKGKIYYQNNYSNKHLKIKKRYYKIGEIKEKELIYYDFASVTCED